MPGRTTESESGLGPREQDESVTEDSGGGSPVRFSVASTANGHGSRPRTKKQTSAFIAFVLQEAECYSFHL